MDFFKSIHPQTRQLIFITRISWRSCGWIDFGETNQIIRCVRLNLIEGLGRDLDEVGGRLRLPLEPHALRLLARLHQYIYVSVTPLQSYVHVMVAQVQSYIYVLLALLQSYIYVLVAPLQSYMYVLVRAAIMRSTCLPDCNLMFFVYTSTLGDKRYMVSSQKKLDIEDALYSKPYNIGISCEQILISKRQRQRMPLADSTPKISARSYTLFITSIQV